MMNLKFISIVVVISFTWFNGWFNNTHLKTNKYKDLAVSIDQVSGEIFYKNQCGFCHTKEELIAPDMNKIKAKYLEKYKTKDAFVKAITTFVKNPNKANAIYKDGIDNFTDMPKMPFKDEQIKAVAEYIFSANTL